MATGYGVAYEILKLERQRDSDEYMMMNDVQHYSTASHRSRKFSLNISLFKHSQDPLHRNNNNILIITWQKHYALVPFV